MKKVVVSLTVLIIAMSCFSQHADSLQSIKADYFRKSKNQKTAAWILLGGGAAMAVTGFAIYEKNYEEDPFGTITNAHPTAAAIATVGLLSCVGSIPLFIASGKNKKRALAISTSFKMEKAPALQRASIVDRSYPALSVRIGL